MSVCDICYRDVDEVLTEIITENNVTQLACSRCAIEYFMEPEPIEDEE
ncbi:MAG: hypothetical protein ACE5KT_01075 [Methanosarcinales archaeon]